MSAFIKYVEFGKKLVNFRYSLKFALSNETRELLIKNGELRDSHHKERCFILGNGPSINDIALKELENEYVFTVNEFYKKNKDFSANYHVMIDPKFGGEEYRDYIESLPKDTVLIANYQLEKAFSAHKNAVFVCDDICEDTGIFVDMSKRMTECCNVVLMAIQCALYMGFGEINLLGCDYNYFTELRIKHFYDLDELEPEKSRRRMGYEMISSGGAFLHHYALDDYSRQHGSIIYNATRGSFIDAYEFKDYPELYINSKN